MGMAIFRIKLIAALPLSAWKAKYKINKYKYRKR